MTATTAMPFFMPRSTKSAYGNNLTLFGHKNAVRSHSTGYFLSMYSRKSPKYSLSQMRTNVMQGMKPLEGHKAWHAFMVGCT